MAIVMNGRIWLDEDGVPQCEYQRYESAEEDFDPDALPAFDATAAIPIKPDWARYVWMWNPDFKGRSRIRRDLVLRKKLQGFRFYLPKGVERPAKPKLRCQVQLPGSRQRCPYKGFDDAEIEAHAQSCHPREFAQRKQPNE